MPRKDPVTGCTVLTIWEVLDQEAQREGKGRTGGDLLGDMLEEVGKEEEERARQLSQPEVAKGVLTGKTYLCDYCYVEWPIIKETEPMKRSDIPAYLKKMNDMFAQQMDELPPPARPKKKTLGDLKAGFADGARMTVLQLINDGHLKVEEPEEEKGT